jgi:competence ComEA-like helix-hairpin-helix protein
MGYSRPQLKLLLLLAAILLAGLGVREWRADFPDAAERLERFDREDPPPPPVDPRPLDINHATVEQIARLPGVGPSLARRIVDERDRIGRFDSPDGLRGILGLGRKKVTALREYVTVGEKP